MKEAVVFLTRVGIGGAPTTGYHSACGQDASRAMSIYNYYTFGLSVCPLRRAHTQERHAEHMPSTNAHLSTNTVYSHRIGPYLLMSSS